MIWIGSPQYTFCVLISRLMASTSLKVALLGAGLFSKDVYAKLLTQTLAQKCSLAAVWSRSREAVESFVSSHTPGVTAQHGDDGLQAIFDDGSIHAVIVVLPVQAALQIVQRALAAGKHVLQEKPIAATVAAALEAVSAYRQSSNSLWMFAENYRFEQIFLEACKLTDSLGTIIKLDLVADLPMDGRNKYFGSTWRRDTAGCPGGFIMESSVHFIAALRLLAHSCGGGEAASVSSLTVQAQPALSPPDSVVGIVRFGSGLPASVSITLACNHVHWSLSVVGTEGTLEISRGGWTGTRAGYTLTYKRAGDSDATTSVLPFTGMQTEVEEFLRLVGVFQTGGMSAVVADSAGSRGAPEEGVKDLALLEALLASGAAGGQLVTVA